MAKIKLNSLPQGFEIKDGKVMKKMKQGGMTGDQSGYGLTTTTSSYGSGSFNNAEDNKNVRYSLSSVPKDIANIEAEGGETVLTDLNGAGKFGLYDIKGPRHSKGGVPMFLPTGAFIFSDTDAMKFDRNELAEFGVESKKKITPAKVSKKYQLNEFIGALADEDADSIKVKSAELMLNKNMMDLSKVAFAQEAKKQFSDGLPKAAYPYIVSKGQDPEQMSQQIEARKNEQNVMNAIGALPPEQQAKAMALRQMMGDQNSQGMEQPMARDGYELPKAQVGLGNPLDIFNYGRNVLNQNKQGLVNELYKDKSKQIDPKTYNPSSSYGSSFLEANKALSTNKGFIPYRLDDDGTYPVYAQQAIQNENAAASSKANAEQNMNAANAATTKRPVVTATSSDDKSNIAYSPKVKDFYNRFNINVNDVGVNATTYKDVQGYQGEGLYGDAASNLEGWKKSWSPLYPDADKLIQSLPKYGKGEKNPEVVKFQKWQDENYIPEEMARIKKTWEDEGNIWTPELQGSLEKAFKKDFGFDPNATGKDYDGFMGTFTSSRRPWDTQGNPKTQNTPDDSNINITPEDPNYSYVDPAKDFWMQDYIKMGAQAQRDRALFTPWQPNVEIPQIDYILEDPTRALADTNEQLNIAGQALGAFAGPQSLSARLSQAQGNAFKQNANTFAQVHNRNVGTVNQALGQNAQLRAVAQRENRDRQVKQYDDTMLTFQNYLDEKNVDREQMADLSANAYTNMANTYNMNTLYPYYNINPNTGGTVDWNGGAPPMIANNQAGNQMDLYDQMTQRAIDLKSKNLDAGTINLILNNTYGTPAQAPTQKSAYPNADSLRAHRQQGMSGGYGISKSGKEIKPYATPFYIGKTFF